MVSSGFDLINFGGVPQGVQDEDVQQENVR